MLGKINCFFYILIACYHIQNAHCVKDFREMGTSSLKKNSGIDKGKPMGATETLNDPCEACSKNSKRAHYFLKRTVQTILNRLGTKEKFKDAKTPLHLTLPVVLSRTDFEMLESFTDSKEKSQNYQEIEAIISNLLQPAVVDSGWEFSWIGVGSPVEWIQIFPVICLITLGLYIFISAWIHMIRHRSRPIVQILICFGLICIFSYTWEFVRAYEEATAKIGSSRESFLAQCDPAGLKETNGILGYINVQLFGDRHKCEKLYVEAYKNPMWSVNPLEVLSQSFAFLVFSQLPYIGDKVGQFISGVLFIAPDWLKPVILGPLVVFLLVGIFGFRVSSPLLSFETRGIRNQREQREQDLLIAPNNPNIEQLQQ